MAANQPPTIVRHASPLTPSMFMAQLPQMPSLRHENFVYQLIVIGGCAQQRQQGQGSSGPGRHPRCKAVHGV